MKVARSAPLAIAPDLASPTTSCTSSATSRAAPTRMRGSSTRRRRRRWWAARRPSARHPASSTMVNGWSTREAYGVCRGARTGRRGSGQERVVEAGGTFVRDTVRPPRRPRGAAVPIRPIAVDRAAGVLLGEACGDALGVPYEMAAPPIGEAVMKGGGLGPYEPGEWSDDTQMTLCVARVAARGIDLTSPEGLDEVAEAFTAWLDGGATDVGIQTREVLTRAKQLEGRPHERLTRASEELHARTGLTAGNGALMRTPIVGLSALDDREATARAARAVAELTHADPLAGDSAVLWSEAIRVAVTEGRLDLTAGLDLVSTEHAGHWGDWIEAATGADPGGFGDNGFTVTALQDAWAAITSTDRGDGSAMHLQRGLQAAVRAGHDTDTVAAIAGSLLGARYGASAVPTQWRRMVHGWPGLRAHDLVELAVSTSIGGRRHGEWPSVETVADPAVPPLAQPHPIDPDILLGSITDLGRV